MMSQSASRIVLKGRVQGFGVRPAIARLARIHGLNGRVKNTGDGVQIDLSGSFESLQIFERQLRQALPEKCQLDGIQSQVIDWSNWEDFQIESSVPSDRLSVAVPPDLAVCDACMTESLSPGNRRFQFGFTSCAECGPRYSLINSMPYERHRTTMSRFTLCEACAEEYSNCMERRFHAQTNSCCQCGPQVKFTDGQMIEVDLDRIWNSLAATLRNGNILALRGVGGYQLLVDATSGSAVRRLRQRKARPAKPLAILAESVTVARQFVRLTDREIDVLNSPQNPIVLLPALPTIATESRLTADLNPGLNTLGVMLPSTPLHAMIVKDIGRPLVVTSANLEGEPLCFDSHDSELSLPGIADAWLHHDREIAHPIDDSVVRVIADRTVTIRLARGMAPLPLPLKSHCKILATGGNQKVACAISNGEQSILGPYIGDLSERLSMRHRWLNHVSTLQSLYRFSPDLIAHDMHPDYFTTQWANEQGLPTSAIQHHHAHIVTGMLEHRWLDRKVLGVAFDGTGYGPDGTIWGGEFLVCDALGFDRVGSLRGFSLAGGELAIREPYRIACQLLYDSLSSEEVPLVIDKLQLQSEFQRLSPLLSNPRLSPHTTSCGRLFDGVAALCLNVKQASFEGEAAQFLESVCDLNDLHSYPMPLRKKQIYEFDWRPMIRGLVQDKLSGHPAGILAMRFHRSLARAVTEVCQEIPGLPIVLGGGVFQNKVLVELIAEQLNAAQRELALPGVIPTNDGGLAAGQLAIAMARQEER